MSFSDLHTLIHRCAYLHTYMHEVLWKRIELRCCTSEQVQSHDRGVNEASGRGLAFRKRLRSQWGGPCGRKQAQTNSGRREPGNETEQPKKHTVWGGYLVGGQEDGEISWIRGWDQTQGGRRLVCSHSNTWMVRIPTFYSPFQPAFPSGSASPSQEAWDAHTSSTAACFVHVHS